MSIKRVLIEGLSVFAVTLIVTGIVTFLWNFIGHGSSTIDWETSFRFAILFGIILPWIETRRSKRLVDAV
jgi:uncharacterized membrane-anchored protein